MQPLQSAGPRVQHCGRLSEITQTKVHLTLRPPSADISLTRHNRRSTDYQREIQCLRDQLEASRQPSQTSSHQAPWTRSHRVMATPGNRESLLEAPISTNNTISALQASDSHTRAMGDVALAPIGDSLTTSAEVARHVPSPGITTVPGVDPPVAGRRMSYAMPGSKSLGNTTLSIPEIDELFQM